MKTYNQFISDSHSDIEINESLFRGLGKALGAIRRTQQGAGKQWAKPGRAADWIKGIYGAERLSKSTPNPLNPQGTDDEFGRYNSLAIMVPGKVGYAALVTDLVRRMRDKDKYKDSQPALP